MKQFLSHLYVPVLAFSSAILAFFLLVVLDVANLRHLVLLPDLGEENTTQNLNRILFLIPVVLILVCLSAAYAWDRFSIRKARNRLRGSVLAIVITAAVASIIVAARRVDASASFFIVIPLVYLAYVGLLGGAILLANKLRAKAS